MPFSARRSYPAFSARAFGIRRRLDTRAEVDGLQEMPPLAQGLGQPGEDHMLEVIALSLQIAKGRADEDGAGTPGG